jgi:hypothetical protein
LTLQALPEPLFIPFTHKAVYSRVPEVEVEIAATSPLGVLRGRGSLTTPMLVDSGATTTMISSVYARHFGIDLDQCTLAEVVGISGHVEYWPIEMLDMYLCDEWFEVPVLFYDGWPQLLGREVVFDYLNVAFGYEGLGVNPFVAMGRL